MTVAVVLSVIVLTRDIDTTKLEKLPKERLVTYLTALNRENASRVVSGRGSATRTYLQSDDYLAREKVQAEGLARSQQAHISFNPARTRTVELKLAFAP